MSVRVACLTPAGTGAIAVVAVVGPGGAGLLRPHFRRANGSALPEVPAGPRFWFGTLAFGDEAREEVVVASRDAGGGWLEVHTHGGALGVRRLLEGFVKLGAVEMPADELAAGWADADADARALQPLTKATTARAASVLLDQYRGAFRAAVRDIMSDPAAAHAKLQRLSELAPLGRHLVSPWRVVFAGPPNVGKSRLLNALAGFDRSIVDATAGTTRDVVEVPLAFDGWPVTVADTAGLRDDAGELEAAGIARTRGALSGADLVVWVIDATAAEPETPPAGLNNVLVVVNKCDLPAANDWAGRPGVLSVSAATGEGVPGLGSRIAARLVPHAPAPGEGVPFTPELADAVEAAWAAVRTGASPQSFLVAAAGD